MKSKEQFKAAYEKDAINKELKQETNLSICQLLYDLLDNEIESLDTSLISFAAEVLKPKIQLSQEILSKIKSNQIFKNARIEEKSKKVIVSFLN